MNDCDIQSCVTSVRNYPVTALAIYAQFLWQVGHTKPLSKFEGQTSIVFIEQAFMLIGVRG